MIRYLGLRVSPEFTRPVRVQTRKLRADHRGSLLLQDSSPDFYLRDTKTSQMLPHCVQASPAPRRQRVTQQRSLEPMATSGTQDHCWLGVGLLGEWCRVLALLFPDWSICL